MDITRAFSEPTTLANRVTSAVMELFELAAGADHPAIPTLASSVGRAVAAEVMAESCDLAIARALDREAEARRVTG